MKPPSDLTAKPIYFHTMTIYIRQLALSMLTATALTASALSLPDLPDRDGMAIKGYVHDGTNTLAGVPVTDGYSIVTTGTDGSYYIPYNPAAEMVYVVVPSGYNPECTDGISRFWQPIRQGGTSMQADFALVPTGNDTRHTMLVLGDPQMRNDHDHGLFVSDALPDIKQTINNLKADGTDVGVLVLGDICFNNPSTYPRYTAYWPGINTPLYHVPGNHDKHIVTDASAQAPEYKATFGPLYYSFNKGKVHYLMLDNVNVTSEGAYDTNISDDALAWVTQDLSMVPEGTTVIVCVHQPITNSKTTAEANKNLLLSLSKYRTIILSAHKHYAQNLGKYSLSAAPDADIEERIHTALCGAYWYGDVAKDGTPLGYYVYDVDGSDISWQFKALGDDDYSQITIHEPAPFGSRLKVDVNVYDYDSHWSVSWKLDGVDKGRMYNYEALDPHANALYANHEKTWCRPALTKHLFYGYLTKDYSEVEVNATDRFGRTHTCKYGSSSGLGTISSKNLHVSVADSILTVASEMPVSTIGLYTVSGSLCMTSTGISTMDVSALPAGAYVVKTIFDNGQSAVEKIILR